MANKVDCPSESLAKMSERHLGVALDKGPVSYSNWEADELSRRQILYAAEDAYVAIKLFRFFNRKWNTR